MTENYYILFLAGMAGAIIKDIIQDNALVMPKKINGKLFLCFIGGAITGGFVGLMIDHDPITAFMSGYTGSSLLQGLLVKKPFIEHSDESTIENVIRMIARKEGVDPDLAVKVAKCESNLKADAININTDGKRDRGIFQINEKWHPQVTDEQAFDPVFSTHFFCKAFKGGNLSWWKATQACWQK